MASLTTAPHIAEIIETTSTRFQAECSSVDQPPPLGSFVKVCPRGSSCSGSEDPFGDQLAPDGATFALVTTIASGSGDPNRRPAAYGLEEEDLANEQPQIAELLTTCFGAQVIGHVANGRVVSYVPGRPPALHARVYSASDVEVRALTERLDYVRSVLNGSGPTGGDEVIAASIRAGCAARGNEGTYLREAGKQLALMLRDDYDRLSAIVRKLA